MCDGGRVTVVGGGLAGCECALQLAMRGVPVRLIEQRGAPGAAAPAHHTNLFAELVCSNSLKSTRGDSAAGLLKSELAMMGCQLLEIAHKTTVPAGGALAVDREAFAQAVTSSIESNPLVEVVRQVVTDLPQGPVIVAAGPLCADGLADSLTQLVGRGQLAFYDAAAPVVDAQSVDRTVAFAQSRWDGEGVGDYLNCPMGQESYDAFVDALISARRVILRDFERRDLFNACQPIEEIARTGHDALRFGALKPVGLVDPRTRRRPWAVVQLRAENAQATAYNIVGFQTNLTWSEQRRVFRMIPALADAEFLRYGVMHRNSFVDAPRVLDPTFKIVGTDIRLAGQITGTEGYVEAMASGLLAAVNTYAELVGAPSVVLPATGAFGSLAAYATDPGTMDYQPMHVNFGLVPPLERRLRGKRERYEAYVLRARADLSRYLASRADVFGKAAMASLAGTPHDGTHDA